MTAIAMNTPAARLIAGGGERLLLLGEVERLEMPPGMGVAGLESDGGDRFFCGGGKSGMVRAVRRPKRVPKPT